MEVRGSAEVSGVQVQVSGVQVQVLTMCVLQMRMQGLSPENETLGGLGILTDSVVPYFRPCFRVCSYAI